MVLRCDYIENYSKNLKKQAEALIELPYDQDHAILLDVEAPFSTSMAFSMLYFFPSNTLNHVKMQQGG
jgi:hypothetical protein